MKNIAIIPARSGSKGLKDKNVKLLCGKPLLWYSVQAAKASGCFEEIMVSTDSEQYAQVARECGASVPFLRSAAQSGDTAGSWDVVAEVLVNYKQLGYRFDTVCLLQPTSPLRCAEDIVGAYDKLKNSHGANAITSVCEVDHSPLWTMTLSDDGSLDEFRKRNSDFPRQKLQQYYRINGAVYIRKLVDTTVAQLPEYAYVMDKKRSIDIDTIEDFEYAEWYLEKKKVGFNYDNI